MTLKNEAPPGADAVDITSKNPPGAEAGGSDANEALSGKAAQNLSSTNGALVQAAHGLAAMGYAPIPMIASAKRPAMKGWREAAADPARALAAVEAAPWADGLAIATGDALMVLDVDIAHADNADGALSLAALEAAHGPLPDGPRSTTPKGGEHRYFATAPGRLIRSSAAIAPGLDIRAEAGLAMCPPSPGRRWIVPLCSRVELPQAPAWLLDLADPPRPPPPAYRPQPIRSEGYVRAVFEGELNALARAPRGERNAMLFKVAARFGDLVGAGLLSQGMAIDGLFAAAHACGLIADDGARAVTATVASGLQKGATNPAPRLGGRTDGRV